MYLTDKLRKNIFLSLCIIIAVALNYFETVIVVAGVIPGIKIGISNIIVLTVIYAYSFNEGILISIFKSVLIALLFGNGLSFIYSLLGGISSAAVMALLKKSSQLTSIGVSMAGSFIHITVQIITAYFILNSLTVFYYYPYMLLISIITGLVNGLLVKIILPKIERRI